MKFSRYEQETVVNYNAGEQTATLYTYKLTGQDEVSKTYFFPKSYISYRKPRAVSTEQRERARQMMIEGNKGKED